MPHVRSLALAVFLLASLMPPVAALASTKCLCNNGVIADSMDDDENACDDACEEFGGGRKWTPEDAGYAEGDVVVDDSRREPVREPAEPHPVQRR
jgi:hypothetical protein